MTEPSDHLKRHYKTWGKRTKPPSPAVPIILRFGFFILLAFGILFIVLKTLDDRGSPDLLIAGSFTLRVTGGLITLLGATTVAVRAAHGDKLAALAPWIVTALVGALIVEPNWGVGIGLGAVVAAVIVKGATDAESEPTLEPSDE